MVFFAVDGAAAGIAAVADPIKESTPEAIAALKRSGIRIVMLTGDSRARRKPSRGSSASTRRSPKCCPRTRRVT